MGEAVLKNAVFGGYDKKDVMDYIDSVWNESEQKQKKLQGRIDGLKAENARLRLRLREASDRSEVIRPEGASRLTPEETMKLPEGSYLVEGGDKLLRLPTPGSGDAARETDAAWDLAAVSRMERSEKGTQLAAGAEDEEKAAREAAESGRSAGMPAGETVPEEWRETVRSLQKQLEDEKKVRAELETKLAYSTDLLLKIYKK